MNATINVNLSKSNNSGGYYIDYLANTNLVSTDLVRPVQRILGSVVHLFDHLTLDLQENYRYLTKNS